MTTLESIVNTFTHRMGLDLFIERMPLARGPFRFSREVHTGSDWEFWGLGLYVVVSRLQVSPR